MQLVFWHLRTEKNQKLTKILQKLLEKCRKNAKIQDIKMLKTISLLLETMSALLSNLRGESLSSEAGQTEKMTKIFKSLQKLVSICVFVILKHIAH